MLSFGNSRDEVYRCAVNSDGTWALSASSNHTLKMWNIRQTEVESLITIKNKEEITGCATSLSGNIIVSSFSDGTLTVWDTEGKERLALGNGQEAVNSYAVSADGRWIVSASLDKTLKVWDIKTGTELRTLAGDTGHTNAVNGCAISPNREWIADDPNGWIGFTSLATLIEHAREIHFSRDPTLTLEFASLTAFNRGHRKIGYGSHTLLLPLPQFVFANLARHWQEIAPPELAGVIESERMEHYLQDDGVIIVDYHLKTRHVHFTTHQQRGFLGTCTYQLRDPHERTSDDAPLTLPQQILLLANLAFYSGVGYKTAMSLGQTHLITEAR